MKVSNFNTIVKSHQLEEMKEYFDYFDKINYGELNYDGLWKWAGILDSFYKLYGNITPNFNTCVDIGGGLSPIQLILSNYGKVINVDDCSHTGGKCLAWFPTRDMFYEESPGFDYKKENIEVIQKDFLTYIKSVPDNSIDLYVDGCSLIHFDVESEYSFHDGITEIAHHMNRTLKPGGHFISTCDVFNPVMRDKLPNILRNDGITYPHILFKVFCNSGLIPLDEADYNVDEFFSSIGNSHGWSHLDPTGVQIPHYKKQNPKYSTRKDLPKYHSWQQWQEIYPGSGAKNGFPMLIARFVFTKK